MVDNVTVAQLHELMTSGDILLVDVRQPYEYEEVHAPGAVLMPLHTVPLRMSELTDPGKPIYLICRSGNRSWQAAAWLAKHNIKAYNVAGGTGEWLRAGYPIEVGAAV